MKSVVLYLFLGLFLSCSPEKTEKTTCYSQQDPPLEWVNLSIDQGIAGHVWFWKGNFMPVSRGDICQVQRQVYVYELTTREEVEQIGYTPFFSSVHTELVTSVESDEEGFFQVELEPGSYSLFVQEGEYLYSNSYGGNGEIFRVDVTASEVTETRINITHQAVF